MIEKVLHRVNHDALFDKLEQAYGEIARSGVYGYDTTHRSPTLRNQFSQVIYNDNRTAHMSSSKQAAKSTIDKLIDAIETRHVVIAVVVAILLGIFTGILSDTVTDGMHAVSRAVSPRHRWLVFGLVQTGTLVLLLAATIGILMVGIVNPLSKAAATTTTSADAMAAIY